MKNHELLFAAVALIGGIAAANYRLGSCYWRHKTIAKWVLSLISALVILASALQSLVVYCPGITPHLKSPLNAIIALLALASTSTICRYCFKVGDRSVQYIPNPNQLDEIDDIPPIPTTAK